MGCTNQTQLLSPRLEFTSPPEVVNRLSCVPPPTSTSTTCTLQPMLYASPDPTSIPQGDTKGVKGYASASYPPSTLHTSYAPAKSNTLYAPASIVHSPSTWTPPSKSQCTSGIHALPVPTMHGINQDIPPVEIFALLTGILATFAVIWVIVMVILNPTPNAK